MYCNVQDIETYYQGKEFDCDGYITNIEVESMIIGETAFIKANLRKRYSLPITGKDDLTLMKMLCEKLVVGTIDDIIREKDPTDKLERQRNYRKEALAWIKMLNKGELILDQTEKSSVIKFNNVDSNGSTVEKAFKVSDILSTSDILDRERRTVIRVS